MLSNTRRCYGIKIRTIGTILILCLSVAVLPVGRSDISQSVSLTANILPEVAIEVNQTAINFGDLYPGETSNNMTLLIENDGCKKIWVTANVTDDGSPLYVLGIKIDENPWNNYNVTMLRGGSTTVHISLDVPVDYSAMGVQNGTLTFWATAIE